MTTLNTLVHLLAAFLCVGLACVGLLRDRRSFPHRVFAAGMLALGLEAFLTALSVQAILPERVFLYQRFRWMVTAVLPGTWMLFSLSFPQGNRAPSLGAWKWAVLAAFVVPAPFVTIFSRDLFTQIGLSPTTHGWALAVGRAGYDFQVCFLVFVVLTMMLLEKALRASRGRKRWQVKFLALGILALLAARVFTSSQVLLLHRLDLDLEIVNAAALLVAGVMILIALARARFLHADIYLSQTVLYRSAALLFVGVYLLLVAVLAKVTAYFTGTGALPFQILLVFLAFTGLALALLSDRIRLRTRQYISRHFKRPYYDYRKAWNSFTERTASLVDEQAFSHAIVRMISEMFDTLSVTLWLEDRPGTSLRPGASTVLSEAQAAELADPDHAGKALARLMRSEQEIVDLEEAGAAGLMEGARVRYCIPLKIDQAHLGLITLGDRVREIPLSLEEKDMLTTIAYQISANLLNRRLAEQLQEARETEAFQKIAAVFVHDLKNTASKLALLLKTLPVHFDKPEFRQDALRAISQSVEKINQMCGRLSSVRETVDLEPEEMDLNEVVHEALEGLQVFTNGSVREALGPLPRLRADPEQVRKVVTNLVMNAQQAAGEAAEIRVETGASNGWAVLTVSDNGCGIPKAFLERDLFRPFRTTKAQGTGIGLFHTKMIVDAHKGRIEVSSREGRGTTVRVFLPLA